MILNRILFLDLYLFKSGFSGVELFFCEYNEHFFSCRNIFWYRSGFYFRICFLFGSGFCFRIRIPILGMNRNQLKVWLQVRRCRRRKVRAGFASDSTDFCDCEYCSLFASTCIMVEEMERSRTGGCKKPEIRILRV